jgi:hypothetical protein
VCEVWLGIVVWCLGTAAIDTKSKLGIRNLSPHLATPQYCGQPNRLLSCGLQKSCGTAIADLQKLTSAIPQLSAVSCQFRYFLVPFSSAQEGFKNQSKILLELSVSLEAKNWP